MFLKRPRLPSYSLQTIAALSLLWFGAFAGGVCAFLTQALLARNLGPASFGTFVAALNMVILVSPLASFGLGSLWLRVFGEEGWKGKRWLNASLRYASGTTVAVLVSLLIWAQFGPHDSFMRWALYILTAALLGQVAVELVSARLQLEARYQSLALWQFLPHFLRLLMIAALVFLFSGNLSLEIAALVYSITALAIFGIGSIYLWQMYQGHFALSGHGPKPTPVNVVPPITVMRVVSEAWPFGFAGIFHLIYFQIDVVLLKYMVSNEAAGIYNAAFLIMGVVYLFPSVIYQKFLLPKIHRWANHDSKRFVHVYNTGRWVMLLLGMTAMVTVWVLAPWGINLLFGAEYDGAVTALRILVLAVPLRFAATSIGSVLTTNRYMRIKVYLMAFVAIANIVLNLMLIPRYEILGSAIATVGSELLLLLLYHFFSVKYVISEHIK